MSDARDAGGWLVTSLGLITWFAPGEFHVGPWPANLRRVKPQESIVDMMHEIRSELGLPVLITSGVRTRAANSSAGGSPTSLHLTGEAADWKVGSRTAPAKKGWELIHLLEHLTERGRTGRYGIYHRLDGGHVHTDRDTSRGLRRWVTLGDGTKNIVSMDVFLDRFGVEIPEELRVVDANRALGWL